MSVINKMLQDLEKRQQNESVDDKAAEPQRSDFVKPQLQYQQVPSRGTSIPFKAIFLLAILIIPTAWFGMSLLDEQSNLQTQTAAVEQEQPSNLPQQGSVAEPATEAPKQDSNALLASTEPIASDEIDATQTSTTHISTNHISTTSTIAAATPAVENSSDDLIAVNLPVTSAAEQVSLSADELSSQSLAVADAQSEVDAPLLANEPVKDQATQELVLDATDLGTDELTDEAVTVSNNIQLESQSQELAQQTVIASPEPALSSESSALMSESSALAPESSALAPESSAAERSTAQVSAPEPVEVVAKAKAPEPQNQMQVTEVVLSKKQLAQRQYALAVSSEEQQNLSQAASQYLEAIILQPDFHKARNQLASAYHRLNNTQAAIRVLERGAGIFPKQWEFYALMARYHTVLGEYDKALTKINYIDDKSSWARDKWIEQTVIAQQTGRHELAESAYRSLLTLESTQGRWWMGLAYALDSQQQFSQAAQAYRSALNYPGLSTTAMEFIENRLVELGDTL